MNFAILLVAVFSRKSPGTKQTFPRSLDGRKQTNWETQPNGGERLEVGLGWRWLVHTSHPHTAPCISTDSAVGVLSPEGKSFAPAASLGAVVSMYVVGPP